jgi:hypothetical protein
MVTPLECSIPYEGGRVKASRLSALHTLIRNIDNFLLHEIATCPIVFDYEDEVIIATAKGEIQRRSNGRR